jgi:DNA-binding CsgD family transcriptional regulator
MPDRAVLHGRDDELSAISALLTKSGSGGLLLSGEPGIGKTALWEAGVRHARDAGWTVLQHRSAQAEVGLAFAGLSDLVGDVFDEIAASLAAPRRRALAVALLLAEPDGVPPDSRALGLALLDAARVLAARAPVLVALDDVQWLDPSSAAVISIALRRLSVEPISVLATERTQAGDVASHARFDGRVRHLALAPLDLTATHRLLHDGLGLELSRPVLTRVHGIAGGNPYFASELARSAAVEGVVRDIHVPDSLSGLLGERLDRMSERTLELLLDAAVAARPSVGLLAPDGELGDLDEAIGEGIVRVDGSLVRFTHPLLASVVYERVAPGRRQSAHRRVADLVGDPDERARHLALAAGDVQDAALASALDEAGHRTAARGATASAAELMELAARHTPAEDVDGARSRFRAAAGFHHLAGDLERAGALYAQLAAELPRGPARAEVLYATALFQKGDVASRLALLRDVLVEAGDDDGLAAQILGLIAITHWLAGDVLGGLAEARAGLSRAERVDDPRLLATAIARVGVLETWALEVTPGLVERGVAIEQSIGYPLRFQESPTYILRTRQILGDELDQARADLTARLTETDGRGDEPTRGHELLQAIMLEHAAGRYARAMEYGRAASMLAEQLGDTELQSMTACFEIATLVDLGRETEARRRAKRTLELAHAIGDEGCVMLTLSALGRLELARGDLDAADGFLADLPDRLIAIGHLQPAGMGWPEAIQAHIGLGRLERAAVLLQTYDDLAARSSRWARSTAARCHGLLCLAQGDDASAVAALKLSLKEEGGMYPLERGRTLIALGVVHRHARRNREARETLERAVTLLDEIGAQAWRGTAEDELKRISGRRAKTDDALTAAEQRVAELAAQGRKNKEIAATLFLAVGTVEMHLSRVYRKLGVRSRTELAGRFGGGSDGVPNI